MRDCGSSTAGAPREAAPAPPGEGAARAVRRVAIAAGGTAGHVVPALAVADALRDRGAEVHFIGGGRAETDLVPEAGFPFHRMRVEGLDRSNPFKAARALGLAGAGGPRSRRLLKK